MRVAPQGICVEDGSGRITDVNPALCAMTGYAARELLGREASDVWSGSRLRRKDGTLVEVEVSTGAFGPGDPRIVTFLRDVTERKQVEDALRESQGWLHLSQHVARIGSYVYDVSTDRWSPSAALEEIFGIDPGHPRSAAGWLQVVHPEEQASMAAYLAGILAEGTRFDREYRVLHPATGEVRWVHGLGELRRAADGRVTQLVGTIQDVTRRKMLSLEHEALQAQLALASRLAAIGTLVAGVAHEINNPLAATLSGLGIALEEAQEARAERDANRHPGAEEGTRRLGVVVDALREADEGARRVADIVKDLATFANPNPERSQLRLEDVVAGAMRWVRAAAGSAGIVRVEGVAAPPVVASAGQIEQVVVNLLTNAVKASPPGTRGEVLVRIGPGSPGMARIDVVDRGAGIDPAIRDRIFEPFFTTRRVGVGRGAGLGLAISHAIVTAHGGTITVESELGQGSTFRVELPVAPGER
ncbi:MAG TPA: PAS domain S-box protein [Anaeromyxobacteraceae bacterium]|nr:PAS domain S-box protein [Anaeromyxobacteraceae bacterium]